MAETQIEVMVNPHLSEDQEFFQSTTKKYLAAHAPISRVRELAQDPLGYDLAAWRQGAELGWFSMLVPEADGGGSVSGNGVVDLTIIAEELGRVLFPGPVVATNVVAAAIARFGTSEQAGRWLPGIVAGETVASWAVAEPDGQWDETGVAMIAQLDAEGIHLSGTKTAVEYGDSVDLLLVTARSSDGVVHLLVPRDAPGVTVVPLESMDLARRFCEVQFTDVVVPPSSLVGNPVDGETELDSLLALATALQCAETLGAMEQTFDFTLEYSKDRRAFGRPIGSFQVIKHHFADMALWLESAAAATAAAAEAVQIGHASLEAVSVAKAYIGDRAVEVVRECLQIHGGIGFTWEHDIHLFLRRVESNRAIFGDPEFHLDRVAEVVGL